MLTATSIGKGGLGRFGNQLFTIAGVIGIADRSGQPFGFPKWMNYDNALFGGEVTDFSEVFENPLPEIPEGMTFQEYEYFWGYRNIIFRRGDWSINAHLQSGKFFEHSIDKVRHYFKMKDEPEQNEYVAIHYRAGDYEESQDSYHPRCSKEYYKNALKNFPNEKFQVFSDNPYEAMELFNDIDYGIGNFIYSLDNYIEDFKVMKRCKSFIIANSSFSAMAAHLGEHPEKKVVAPKRWFGTKAGLDTKDIYNENWIVI